MRVEIDLRIIALVLFLVFTSQAEIYLLFFIFIFLHELAHIIVRKDFWNGNSECITWLFGIFSTDV